VRRWQIFVHKYSDVNGPLATTNPLSTALEHFQLRYRKPLETIVVEKLYRKRIRWGERNVREKTVSGAKRKENEEEKFFIFHSTE
jgi:hypothetical protein